MSEAWFDFLEFSHWACQSLGVQGKKASRSSCLCCHQTTKHPTLSLLGNLKGFQFPPSVSTKKGDHQKKQKDIFQPTSLGSGLRQFYGIIKSGLESLPLQGHTLPEHSQKLAHSKTTNVYIISLAIKTTSMPFFTSFTFPPARNKSATSRACRTPSDVMGQSLVLGHTGTFQPHNISDGTWQIKAIQNRLCCDSVLEQKM